MALSEFEQAQSYALYVIWVLISLPTVCYISYQLKQNWDDEWLIRRRRVLILIICILLFYSILIECPCFAVVRLDISLIYTIIIQVKLINNLVRLWLCSLFVLRIYLLYYDHEYNRTLCKNKWQILMQPRRHLIRQQTWFLANRHGRYGDERWILSHIVVPITLSYSIVYAAGRISVSLYLDIVDVYYTSFYSFWDMGCSIVWVVACICVSVFFWRKYPKFADTRLIRREITILIILLLANLCIVPLFSFIQVISSIHLSQFGAMSMSMLLTVVLYVMVMYPQSAEIRNRDAIRKKRTKTDELQVSWQELVSTKEGYESFIAFLGKEFSTENLLFITEYVQLKEAMLRQERLAQKMKLHYDLHLPDKLPISDIVAEFTDKIKEIDMANDTKMNEICWSAMNRIYVKYIHSELSDLEVNISSRRRRDIERVYENTKKEKTIENIMDPMEKCVIEISRLINDSRSRFVEESEFTELAPVFSRDLRPSSTEDGGGWVEG
eukprot:341060_1